MAEMQAGSHHEGARPDPAEQDTVEAVLLAANLVQISELITGQLGHKITSAVLTPSSSITAALDGLGLEARALAAQRTLTALLAAFAEVVGADVIERLISVRCETLEETRDSVLNWLELISPLIDGAPHATVPRLFTTEVNFVFNKLSPEVLNSAFRAPAKHLQTSGSYVLAGARLSAVALERQLSASVCEDKPTRETIVEYFGVSGWDTIRKWEEQARTVLDPEVVDYLIKHDEQTRGSFELSLLPKPIQELIIHQAACEYRRTIGHPRMPKPRAGLISDIEALRTSMSPDDGDETADGEFLFVPNSDEDRLSFTFSRISKEIRERASLAFASRHA